MPEVYYPNMSPALKFRKCTKCNLSQPLLNFHKNPQGKEGRKCVCAGCCSIADRKRMRSVHNKRYINPEDFKVDIGRYLQERWTDAWAYFTRAEKMFKRKARGYRVGDDILANIALVTINHYVNRREEKIFSPWFLVNAMMWQLNSYLKKPGNKQPWQYNEVETEKGIVS